MCVRLVLILLVVFVMERTNGQFQRMFQESTILDKPAGTGKILIQSELKIDTVHMPDACKVQAKKGDTAVFDFDIWLNDNETKFETSQDTEEREGQKMVLVIGAGMVIPGVEAGITNICIGEKRRLVIPPHLAWGQDGIKDVIPENAYVTFDLELLEIVPKTWSQWYIDIVQMLFTVSFVVGTFYLFIQQIRNSRKQQRDAARRERKRLRLRAQLEEDEEEEYEDDEEEDEEEEDEEEEEKKEEEEVEAEASDGNDLDKQNEEWTKFQNHAKSD